MQSVNNWDVANDSTLYAKWVAKQYTVTFDKQNGNGGADSVSATYGLQMPSAEEPTRAGYTFLGYLTQTSSGIQYYTSAMVSSQNWNIAEDTTLYANWVFVGYNITFEENGYVNFVYDQPTANLDKGTNFTFGTVDKGALFETKYITILINGVILKPNYDGNYAIKNIADDIAITVMYKPCLITVQCDSGIVYTGETRVAYGNDYKLSFETNLKFEVRVNGVVHLVSVGAPNYYVLNIPNVTEKQNITIRISRI